MSLGPVELLVLKFPGNQFSGEVVPALRQLVESGQIRIIDIIFAHKDDAGELTVLEINDLDDDSYAVFDPVVEDITGMMTVDDARQLAGSIEANSSAALMLFENVWAKRFADAVVASKGEVLLNERIPRAVIDELLAASAA
jgi:hypothetical protein